MKTLEFEKMQNLTGGDFSDFAGGLACGAAVATVIVNPFMAWIPAIGCINYLYSD